LARQSILFATIRFSALTRAMDARVKPAHDGSECGDEVGTKYP
jgi:hypothetical protein